MGRHGIILLCIPYMEIQGGKSFLNFGIHGGRGGKFFINLGIRGGGGGDMRNTHLQT